MVTDWPFTVAVALPTEAAPLLEAVLTADDVYSYAADSATGSAAAGKYDSDQSRSQCQYS